MSAAGPPQGANWARSGGSAAAEWVNEAASVGAQHANAWHRLAAELDHWQRAGRRADFWWRDDDAYRDSPQLARLLGIARESKVPVALAVIPAHLEPDLSDVVATCDFATVVQHGYAHRNHAPAGTRNWELGAHRPIDDISAELAAGCAQLETSFGPRFAPVLVPPWNRVDPAVVARLPAVGLQGLSTFGPRADAYPVPGVVQCNTHVDLIAWRRDRAFIGAEAALDRLVAHLAARRAGTVDPTEPTGLLTHHLDFDTSPSDFDTSPSDLDTSPWDLDTSPWPFLAELFARTREHGAAAWIDVRAAFYGVTSDQSA